jgi:hypothetical protein
MEGHDKELGSEHWMPDFEKTAMEFLKYMHGTNGGAYVNLTPGIFEQIKLDYRKAANRYKTETEGNQFADTKIDHHKIIAFYILSFLKLRPFCYEPPGIPGDAKRNWLAMLPNEYFCICLIQLIIMGWTGEHGKRIRFPTDEYRKCLIILFHRIRISPKYYDIIPIAHIIYFIEKYFFK